MLFNSYVFLFAFLPITLAGYEVLARMAGKRACILWLTAVSLVFYGWWSVPFAGLLVASIVTNAALGRWLVGGGGSERTRTLALAFGIGANLAALGYFKYAGFLVASLGALIPSGLHAVDIVLPIAISFYTFQQIAFLIDARHRKVEDFSLAGYFLFVTFFPQLIAGPILHHQEMMPQFAGREAKRLDLDDLAVGLSVFAIGLFKKAVLADVTARWADPVFAAAGGGVELSFAEAWVGTLAFTFQLYFDFSGYSDMALGLGRMFGIRLPLNFQSPYKSASIIEFWQRWHMTLTRFFNQYLYAPMTMAAVRRRARLGLGVSARAIRDPAEFIARLAVPTLVTMFLVGVWHGAGFQFMAFGLVHGAGLVVNHAWRSLRRGLGADGAPRTWTRPFGVAITFLTAAVSFVFFRSPSLETAFQVLGAMFGANGISLGQGATALAGGHVADLARLGIVFDGLYPHGLITNVDSMGVWLAVLMVVVMTAPNTYDIFRDQGIALEAGVRPGGAVAIAWRRAPAWALATGVMLSLAALQVHTIKPFIYFQF